MFDVAAVSSSSPGLAVTAINGGTFGSGPDTLLLSLSEDAYQGDAQAFVSIDGTKLTTQPISVVASHAAGQYELFTFKGSFGPGGHTLGISFINDAYGGTPSTDRNLYVNASSYDGVAPRPGSGVLLSNGTQNATIPPANDPEAFSTTINGGTIGSGPDTLVVSLSEDAWKGNAQAIITIDGTALTPAPLTVSALHGSAQTEVFTFKGTFGPGAHDLGVAFTNDAYGGTPSTDRNLYLDNATYNGLPSRQASATFLSGGTQHFTIPPADDPEAQLTAFPGGR